MTSQRRVETSLSGIFAGTSLSGIFADTSLSGIFSVADFTEHGIVVPLREFCTVVFRLRRHECADCATKMPKQWICTRPFWKEFAMTQDSDASTRSRAAAEIRFFEFVAHTYMETESLDCWCERHSAQIVCRAGQRCIDRVSVPNV